MQNPNKHAVNTVSLEEYRSNFDVDFEFVAAKDLRKGDFLAFPIPQESKNTIDATENRARLLGYFLAEGSFIKREGVRIGVSFSFGSHERDTLVAEAASLLDQEWGRHEQRVSQLDWQREVDEKGIVPIRRRSTSKPVPKGICCPSCEATSEYAYNVNFAPQSDKPCYQCKVCGRQWIEGVDRSVKARIYEKDSTCVVNLLNQEAAEWFYKYGGEYANGKHVHTDVMLWEPAIQRHVLLGWLNGEGVQSDLGITGNTASFDLMSQMHVIAARCGWYSRKNVLFGAKTATLDQVVNGRGPVTVRDDRGWLPSFGLVVTDPGGFGADSRFTEPEKARVTMSAITDSFKRVGDWLIYKVRGVHNECYSGPVFNLEVEGDHSYVVDGLAVHNCNHIKYEKGNHFFDRSGVRRKIAELCGHMSIDPTGGVQFIEASWVETPAFTGAVLRNVLDPMGVSAELSKKAEDVLNTPPTEWSSDKQLKAAQQLRSGQFDLGDEGDEEEGGGDEQKPDKTVLDDLEEEIQQHILQRVRKKLKEQMTTESEKAKLSPENSTTSLNNTIIKEAVFNNRRAEYRSGVQALVKTASSDVALVDQLARYNQTMGIEIPVDVYRAVVAAGATSKYKTVTDYLRRCNAAAERDFTLPECRTLVRLGKLLEDRTRFY